MRIEQVACRLKLLECSHADLSSIFHFKVVAIIVRASTITICTLTEVGAKSTSCNLLQLKQDMMVNGGCSISATSISLWDNIFKFHLEDTVKVFGREY